MRIGSALGFAARRWAILRIGGVIEEKGYLSLLRREGMKTIYQYGIACYKKSCRVMCACESWGSA